MADVPINRIIAMAEIRGVETGVTLTLPEVIISGVVISHRAYIRGFAAQLRTLETGVRDLLAPLADEFEELASLLPDQLTGDAAADALPYRWIYLKHAILITPAGAVRVGYWFGETIHIADYRLGERDLGERESPRTVA